MRTVPCNLCGADDYAVVFPKGYAQVHQIVRCQHCGLMYANPQEHVDCEVFAARDTCAPYDPQSEKERDYYQKQLTQLPDNLRALKVLNQVFPDRGKLLEIGSFAGLFLDRIRASGWDVTGLEPDRPVGDYARTRFGLNIVEGVLPDVPLPKNHFDAVVMLHVIEHMPDPGANLVAIRRLLKTGGMLVIETPRFDTLAFKVLGRRERSIQNCPGHIYFFTRDTLARLLEKAGFAVFRAEKVGRTLTVHQFVCNLALITRCLPLRIAMARASRALQLTRLRMYVNVGDMQRVYARAV
jgi:SAM-dependent methyltransferase